MHIRINVWLLLIKQNKIKDALDCYEKYIKINTTNYEAGLLK